MLENILKILDKAVVQDVRVYDTRTYTPFYDTVIICSVNTNRQGNAAANYLKKEAPLFGYDVRNFNAGSDTAWFLVDLNSIIVHIFVQDERRRYNLDGIYEQINN